MKLTIPKQDLARVMTNVGRVVEARNTIPILSHVLLDADADGLRVVGTDLDIVATSTAPAGVITHGAICVDAKLLSDIVKKAAVETISLELDGDRLKIISGRGKFTLQTLPAADFPSFADGSYDAEFELDIAALFAPVAFAMSTEQTRFYLCGVFFVGKDGTFTAVATDGHRLSRNAVDGEASFGGIIVPSKMVDLLPKGVVTVSVSGEKIRFVSGDFSLTSKLIDGTYPDYPRVIPMNNDKFVIVDRQDISKAADRVTTVSSERGRGVKLAVTAGLIALSARSDVGSAEDEVAAEYDDEPIEIGFNSSYLKDVLAVLPDGPVKFALADSGSPARITSDSAPGLDLTLMPMRV